MTSDAHGPVISVMLAVPDAAAAARWYARGHCCIEPDGVG
jgi:hypothetical protein